MGYQLSNTFKTLNHWQSNENKYKYLSRNKGFSISKVMINGQPYYIPPYLRFKDSKVKSLFKSPTGVLDFDNMTIYKGEKYIDNINNMIRYRGLMSFGSDYLIFDPPENYPAYEYWNNTIHFQTDAVGGVLVVDKTGDKQDVVENVIVPKIHRVGLFYGWIRPNYTDKLPKWTTKFEQTSTKFGISSIMDIEYLLETIKFKPEIFTRPIKIPKEWNLQSGKTDGIISDGGEYSLSGFTQEEINLNGKVEYLNGGLYLHKPSTLTTVSFPYIACGNFGPRFKSPAGSNSIVDNIYIDFEDGNRPKSSWSYDTEHRFNYYDILYIEKKITDEESNLIGEYMFTLDCLIEEFKAMKKQTIIKMIW